MEGCEQRDENETGHDVEEEPANDGADDGPGRHRGQEGFVLGEDDEGLIAALAGDWQQV